MADAKIDLGVCSVISVISVISVVVFLNTCR